MESLQDTFCGIQNARFGIEKDVISRVREVTREKWRRIPRFGQLDTAARDAAL